MKPRFIPPTPSGSRSETWIHFKRSSIDSEVHMDNQIRMRSLTRKRQCLLLSVATASVLLPWMASAQALTGALVGTVKDEQGAVLPGATVRVTSPALIGGPTATTTNEKGQLRFPVLPPGPYRLDIAMQGFATLHEEN